MFNNLSDSIIKIELAKRTRFLYDVLKHHVIMSVACVKTENTTQYSYYFCTHHAVINNQLYGFSIVMSPMIVSLLMRYNVNCVFMILVKYWEFELYSE